MATTIEGNGLITVDGTSTTQGRVRLAEDTDNGTNYIELTAPASVTSNRTITLPDNTGTIITDASTVSYPKGGPAFKAYRATTTFSFSASAWSKVQFNAEEYDTASCYDPTTNYRFTPNVAGYYVATVSINFTSSSSPTVSGVALYKNGNANRYGTVAYWTANASTTLTGTSVVYLNGSTDYIEGYVYSNGTSPGVTVSQEQSFFEACLIRAD